MVSSDFADQSMLLSVLGRRRYRQAAGRIQFEICRIAAVAAKLVSRIVTCPADTDKPGFCRAPITS